jgi:hypothetical protein
MYDRTLRWLSNFNQLRILYLTGPVSVTPSLFDIQDTISNNLFPCLDEFALEFTPQTADGRWFFLRDDVAFRNRTPKQLAHDEARDAQRNRLKWTIYGETQVAIRSVKPWCKFRSVPNPETFTPFLCSAARLCSNMPRIKQFSLKLNNNHRNTISRLDYECVDRIFELWFFAAERSLETISDETERPEIPIDVRILHHDRVYFRVGRNPPDNTVVQSWRGVVGRYGKMNFLDEQHCHPLYYGTRRMAYSGEILQEM